MGSRGAHNIYAIRFMSIHMEIIFLRHGETYQNRKNIVQGHQDTNLTAKGKRQAKRLGDAIRERRDVDMVYTSDLDRAIRTAELMDLDAPHETDERLRELDFGTVSGGNLSEFIENNPEYDDSQPYALWTRFPKGESTADVYHRVTDALDDIIERHANNETIVIVGHHTSVSTALSYARGNGVDHTQEIEVPIGTGFHAIVDNGDWLVKQWPQPGDLV